MVKIVRVPFLIPTWAAAQVLGPNTILVKQSEPLSPGLIAHELAHIDQWRKYGWMFGIRYLLSIAKHGYYDSPYEAEARAAAKDPAYLARARDLLKGVE